MLLKQGGLRRLPMAFCLALAVGAGGQPVPIRAVADGWVREDWRDTPLGSAPPHWNLYSPKWAPVTVATMPGSAAKCLQLEDDDPYDAASATRLFPPCATLHASFEVQAGQSDHGTLEIEVGDAGRDARPVRLILSPDGKIQAVNGEQTVTLGVYRAGVPLAFELRVDAVQRRFSVMLDGKPVLRNAAFCRDVENLQRLTFRTGTYREGFHKAHAAPDSDRPADSVLYRIGTVRLAP